MNMKEKIIRAKNGKSVVLRSAVPDDAECLTRYINTIYKETPYLAREPEEFQISVEDEREFLKSNLDHARALLMIAVMDDQHVGNCSVSPLGNFRRYAHRCDISIALYQKFCGLGIGRAMLTEALAQAKSLGYEQAELEVIAANEKAIRLYESVGFQKYGTFPNNMKYKDGTCADAWWMMKKL